MASIESATEPSGKGSVSPIDMPSLRARCLDDMKFVEKVLTMFRKDGPAALTKAEVALTAGELPKVVTAAHTLKGMAANVSAEMLSKEAGELETASKSALASDAKVALTRAKAEMERCLAYMLTIEQRSR